MHDANTHQRLDSIVRTLDTFLDHVPGAPDALPSLARLRDGLRAHGLRALDDVEPLDRATVAHKLKRLLPAFDARQIDAMVNVLTSLDRRGRSRGRAGTILSSPTMFAAEISIADFVALAGARTP